MTLKTQIASDVSSVFLNTDEFAESTTYKVGGSGTGSSINAIIDTQQDLGQGNPGQLAYGVIELSADDVTSPAVYDTITTADGVVWRVDSIIGGDGYTWKLSVSTDHRPGATGV